ncbi:cytochrome P450 [Pavlovales sp. CCMP2436]|nr:cytochrome P450 [Pavlovales sp. CCMP2436]
MHELALTYGDVMELQMGAQTWTVLSSPKAVHEAFIERGSDFAGRPMVPSMAVSSMGKGFAQAVPDASFRALRRTAFTELFSPAAVDNARGMFDAEAQVLAMHLSSSGGVVELRPALRRCVSNMVMRFAFSTRVPYASEGPAAARAADPRTRELVESADAIWQQLTAPAITAADLITPTLASAAHGPLRELVARRDTLLRAMIADRVAAGPSGGQDMLDRLLASGLDDVQVLYSLVDLFIAGVNTVAVALEWMLLLSTRHLYAQARARAEVVDPSATAGGDLRYVRALIDETLRFKPPLLLPRMALRDTQVGGFAVPAGQVVFANSFALSFGEHLWRDPCAFRPTRWLEEEAALSGGVGAAAGSAASAPEARCKFVPFSVGQRSCPGELLARAELEAATVALLRAVRWEAVGIVDLREEYSLTLVPARAQTLRFTKRDAAPAA